MRDLDYQSKEQVQQVLSTPLLTPTPKLFTVSFASVCLAILRYRVHRCTATKKHQSQNYKSHTLTSSNRLGKTTGYPCCRTKGTSYIDCEVPPSIQLHNRVILLVQQRFKQPSSNASPLVYYIEERHPFLPLKKQR